MDLALVLAPRGGDEATASAIREAVRRGCWLVAACPPHSPLAEHVAGPSAHLLPTRSRDPLAVAVVMLLALHELGVGPEVAAEEVAAGLDRVAVECSPGRDIATNPAKDHALALADTMPLVWGGSVLAARAARRVAEAIRRSTGRPALAADVIHLLPVIEGSRVKDLFADPYVGAAPTLGGGLLLLDDGSEEPEIREQRGRLTAAAGTHGVRAQTIRVDVGAGISRYAELLAIGTYTSVYLGIGLGRDGSY